MKSLNEVVKVMEFLLQRNSELRHALADLIDVCDQREFDDVAIGGAVECAKRILLEQSSCTRSRHAIHAIIHTHEHEI